MTGAQTDGVELQDHPAVAALARDLTLKQGAQQGAAWLASSRLTVQGIQFIVSIVTARLLLPAEFGEAALALAIISFGQLFADLGLAAAIVHARTVTVDLLTTAFWLNIGAGAALAAIVAALAYPVSQLYGHHSLFPLLLIASLNFAVTRGAVQTALLERTFNFRRLAIIETTAQTIGITFVPVGAILGLGAESLVLGPVLGTALLSVGLWASVPWRPSGRPSRQKLRELWQFSRGLVGFNTLGYWSRNFDTLLLGGAVSTSQLGQYNRAFNLMMVPVQQMSLVVGRVLFPSLSRLRDDPLRVGRAWIRGLEATAALAMPVTVTLAVAAPALVAVLYGPRWGPTAPILELLALSAVPQILAASSGAVYRSLGLTDLLFKVGMISTSLTVLAIAAGVHWGAQGVAAALLINAWASLPIPVAPLLRATGLKITELRAPCVRILAPALALGCGELGVRLLVGGSMPVGVVLVLQLLAGGVLYVATLCLVGSPAIGLVRGQLGRLSARRGRSRQPPGA